MVFLVLCQFPTWAERMIGGFLIVGRLYVNLGSGSQAFGNIFALQVGPQGCMCSWALLWTVCLRRWRHPTHQVGGALLAPSRHWWFLVNLELMSNTPILRKNDICNYVIQSTLVNYIFSWYIASIFRTFRKVFEAMSRQGKRVVTCKSFIFFLFLK